MLSSTFDYQMENDIKALVEKLKAAVEFRARVQAAKDMVNWNALSGTLLLGLDEQLHRAEAKVATAEVTLMSMVRSIVRK